MPRLSLGFKVLVEVAHKEPRYGYRARVQMFMREDWVCNHVHVYQRTALYCARDHIFGYVDEVFRLAAVGLLLLLFAAPAGAQVRWDGPRQAPADAAAVLRACTACQANVANWPAPLPEGPLVADTGSQPGAQGWLPFPRRSWLGSPKWSSSGELWTLRAGEGITHGRGFGQIPGHLPVARRLR